MRCSVVLRMQFNCTFFSNILHIGLQFVENFDTRKKIAYQCIEKMEKRPRTNPFPILQMLLFVSTVIIYIKRATIRHDTTLTFSKKV